jgi:hypothetical protein
LERRYPGAVRLFAPSETKAARTQLGSGRFKTDDRDCAALTYLARQGAGRRWVDEVEIDELRAVVRRRRGLVHDRKVIQQRLHDQLNAHVDHQTAQHLPVRQVPTHRRPPRKLRALVAIERAILTAVWHMLSTGTYYQDPGPDYYSRHDPSKHAARAVRALRALGYQVTVQPVAAAN